MARIVPHLVIGPKALAALLWSIPKSDDEFCFWGIIEKRSHETTPGFYLKDAVLAKHAGSPYYNAPDMEWYADMVTDKHLDEGLEPWQMACWIHTHPSGCNAPSSVDAATFRKEFGNMSLAIMMIMTKDRQFVAYLRENYTTDVGYNLRSLVRMSIILEDPDVTVPEETARLLDEAYPKLVTKYVGVTKEDHPKEGTEEEKIRKPAPRKKSAEGTLKDLIRKYLEFHARNKTSAEDLDLLLNYELIRNWLINAVGLDDIYCQTLFDFRKEIIKHLGDDNLIKEVGFDNASSSDTRDLAEVSAEQGSHLAATA